MSSPPSFSLRGAFAGDSESLPLSASTFHIPLDSAVHAIVRAAELGADRLYEAMLKTALMVEMKAQTYGLAIYQQRPGEPLTLKWAEGLDNNEVAAGEKSVEGWFEDKAPPQSRAGDQSFSLLLSRPSAHYHGAAIYGRCMRPLTEGQVKELKILTEVAQLAHSHVSLRERAHDGPQTDQLFDSSTASSEDAQLYTLPGVIFESRELAELARCVNRIKDSNSTVLITGESGTGKELIAHALHRLSRRAQSPFIPFNCTAAPADLIESILFGHRKGSFTGAHADHEGLIRAAEGGTLFLDEIGDLPLALQPKLLRFLQEGEVHTLGEREPRQVNVRVVAATHKNLERAIETKEFREDLYYRIASLTLNVPPLRERPDDIAALISHFLTYYTRRNDRDVSGITWEAVHALRIYSWPGNVRELAAEIERLVLYADHGEYIGVEHLSPRTRPAHLRAKVQGVKDAPAPLDDVLQDMERRIITEALKHHNYNVADAATALGLGSRQTLYKKLKRLSININELPHKF